MKYTILLFTLLTTGCTYIPVKLDFPDAPKTLLEKCDDLKTINTDVVTVSELLKIITHNYIKYHECAVKQEAWVDWYDRQRKIFERMQ